ncbi:MAG TPA: MarR family winged helix-turn-helix transcriptional regulator, partial [Burkholderiaceae bacterium]|nr:MarR family winged helix-turn-helix transcriptional regulator [Burkholderiaceae bacterium]
MVDSPQHKPGESATSEPVAAHYDGNDWRAEESVGYLLKQAIASIKSTVDERMSAHGLTDAQWQPLFAISRTEGCTAGDIARRIHCDGGALTRMLDRLEEKGLIARSRSREDRRVVHLELTPEGERAVAIVPHVLAEVLNLHLRGFDRDEVETLKRLLRRLIAAGSA